MKPTSRRQFLADALFAGGALGATALAMRWMLRPQGTGAATGSAQLPAQPVCKDEPPRIEGEVITRGRVAAPRPEDVQ